MTNVVFSLGAFDVLVWHLIAVALLVVAVVLFIVTCCIARKNRKAQEAEQAEVQSENSEPEQDVTESAEVEEVVEPVAEEPAVEESVATEPVVEQQAEVAEPEVAEPVAEEPAVVAEDSDDVEVEEVDDDDEEEVAESGRAVSTVKVYHVSLRRDDGMWQVKLGKGNRALKLFKTQAEAIVFAKEKAKNQEGRVVIHKVDGKIRKLRY